MVFGAAGSIKKINDLLLENKVPKEEGRQVVGGLIACKIFALRHRQLGSKTAGILMFFSRGDMLFVSMRLEKC